MLIVLVVVALLALVLRWTFGRDRHASAVWPAPDSSADPPQDGRPDDFGLLAAAATVESETEAQRIRHVLGIAGIKATTTKDSGGHWRVLVFASELHRARRVAGGSS